MSFMFKHWFEDDPDYVDEDPPKMRENELHTPKRVRVEGSDGLNRCYKICVVCGLKMDYNYCPRCGARLKERKNENA